MHESKCQHVAVIMDGNGRWAERNKISRALGHRAGVKAMRRTVEAAIKYGVKAVTVYAFSTENWKRPKEEVSFLMELFYNTLDTQLKELHDADIRLSFIGNLTALPERLQEKLAHAITLTSKNQTLDLVVAVNYGGRQEIVEACKQMHLQIVEGELSLDDLTESRFEQALGLAHLPPVDLLIRTSGEVRLSNFLLWQLAYAELYFTDCHWPDFSEEHFKAALDEFAQRERRFGGR